MKREIRFLFLTQTDATTLEFGSFLKIVTHTWHMISNCASGHRLQRLENNVYTKTCTWIFMATLFAITKNQKHGPTTNEWLNGGIYTGVLLSSKKEK